MAAVIWLFGMLGIGTYKLCGMLLLFIHIPNLSSWGGKMGVEWVVVRTTHNQTKSICSLCTCCLSVDYLILNIFLEIQGVFPSVP